MKNSNFFRADMTALISKKTAYVGRRKITYGLYVYIDEDRLPAYAITASDGDIDSEMAVKCVKSFSDALALFKIITENEIDSISLYDVADDYFTNNIL